ncbi:Mobile element protein [Moritella sp. JT01]|uniref:IS66 family transposase n=1 Tax=Moritella sp. JT01 TaxID=756698 RepID=UPI000794A1AD|nr:transposase [Moritella sp. JT01]KXO13221.1 Mobile element protein [Moritella sp. JT01]
MALNYIQSLYAIEKKAKSLTPEERQHLRVKKAEPVLQQLHEWLSKSAKTVTPKSKIGVAISYTLNQWEKLRRYLYSGELGIDNNVTERDIRLHRLTTRLLIYKVKPARKDHFNLKLTILSLLIFLRWAVRNGRRFVSWDLTMKALKRL